MLEKYSSGCYANVYKISDVEKWEFPLADLERVDKTSDEHMFASLYYEHKIASLLFPGHFIDVVASTIARDEPFAPELRVGKIKLQIPTERTYTLFSRQADVPKEHAVFSSHMTLDGDDDGMEKVSVCPCSQCSLHRRFHYYNSLKDLAETFAKQTSMAGVEIPNDDMSDYCLGRNGIIFFEINRLDTDKAKAFINTTSDSNIRRTATDYLHRYEKLHAIPH